MRYARQASAMEAVLLLLKYGADVNAMTDGRNDFRTVLHYAILSGKYQNLCEMSVVFAHFEWCQFFNWQIFQILINLQKMHKN